MYGKGKKGSTEGRTGKNGDEKNGGMRKNEGRKEERRDRIRGRQAEKETEEEMDKGTQR